MFLNMSQKSALSTGRASVFKNGDRQFVSFTPNQAYAPQFYKFAELFADYGRFHSLVKQDVKPTRRYATIERGHIPGDWEGEGDTMYDDITGLLLTTNMDMNTWQDIDPDFKGRLVKAMGDARHQGEDVAGVFDGETLVMKPVSQNGYQVLKQYRDHDIVTSTAQSIGSPEVIIAFR